MRMNNNHGSCDANTVPATSKGSLVSVVARRGNAAKRTPSPRMEIVVAVHSLQ
jgi:hypothetical protein